VYLIIADTAKAPANDDWTMRGELVKCFQWWNMNTVGQRLTWPFNRHAVHKIATRRISITAVMFGCNIVYAHRMDGWHLHKYALTFIYTHC
jgi:hypothetical protein